MSWRCEAAEGFQPIDLDREVARLTDPASAVKTLHWGRNYLYIARLETVNGPVEVVVKQFRHLGRKDRLRRRWRGSKAERSWRVAHALLAAGIPTPEPVLWIESDDEAGPSFYICRFLPDTLEARYLVRAANAGREREEFPQIDFLRFLDELGRTARRLHDAGFWHRDLSSGNVLLRCDEKGVPTHLWLVDLNRTRMGRVPTTSERLRDLARMPLHRPEHRQRYLDAYWGAEGGGGARKALYLTYHHGWIGKNRAKQGLRGVIRKARGVFLPRVAHAHIPEAPADAAVRDRIVWDHLSDQPHQHAGRLDKLWVRLADARAHAEEGAAVAKALPRIWRRYRELQAGLYRSPVDFQGLGIALRPWPEAPDALLELVDELAPRYVLLRLHPWDDGHAAEEELAQALAARGCELTFALPQNRDLVKDPARWQAAIERLAEAFTPYGRRFQIGQAINRTKWGIWNLGEYATLARIASDILRRRDVELLGPAVIDFEYHVTAAVLNLPDPGFRFDAVSALLYVDRRGAPENPQAGFDTVGKVALLKAIAETARNSTGRCWITEVNWPLWEGPHSPAGRSVSVHEEAQADYLARYDLLALGTGLVERVFWWQLVARGYGLVDPADPAHPRRRPSFFAMKALLRELEGTRLEEVLPAPPPARLYRFRRPDGSELVAGWSTGEPIRATLPRPAAAVIGRGGEELPVPDGTAMELTSAPKYVRLS